MTTTIQKQILINADRLLYSPDRWIKNSLGSEIIMCLMGALRNAANKLNVEIGPETPFNDAYVMLSKAIQKRQMGGPTSYPIYPADFNDHHLTTFEDVKAVLRDAIDNA